MRRLTDVDLRLIRIFRAIVECQGLAGAELVLNLSQSRISASLAELEARLGVRLCRRGRAGFALTAAGGTVYQASHELFEAVDRFCNQAGTVAGNLRRVLRLGTVDALVTNQDLSLPQAIFAFRRHNPSVVVDFAIAGPEELEQQLIGGTRDILIVPCINKRSELHYLPMLEEKQSLYCARSHPLFALPDARITNDVLSDHPVVARGYLHQFDLKRIGHHGEAATVEIMEAQLILVLSGAFIGYLPAHYAQAWVERGELRALRDEHYAYNSAFYLVTQRGGAESPLIQRFVAAILDARGTARLPEPAAASV
jgi:LysR family transcriptional regulator, transcriptional activator for bauABCD operon